VLLAGCAGPSADIREPARYTANLEPEITELDALKNSRGRPLTPSERQALESKAGIAFRLTPEETEEEKLFFEYFSREKHETVQRWLLRSEPHLEYVRAVLASQRLPQDLLALPYIESGYNDLAVSGSGAVGMWQFMPATARRFGLTVDWWLDERRDPYLSTVAAARYLKALYEQFGDWQLALAAYNAGEGTISRAMTSSGKQSFKSLAQAGMRDETRHYVPKFLAMLKITKNAKRLGFEAPDMRASKDLEEVRIPGGTDLSGLAGYLGLSWEQFHALNPAFRRQVSPPDRTTAAWVPKRLAAPALAFVEHPGAGPGVRMARGGETWWNLSRETGVPANALQLANKSLAKPEPGRPVLIPLAACSLDNGGGYESGNFGSHGKASAAVMASSQGAAQESAGGAGRAFGPPETGPQVAAGRAAAVQAGPAQAQPTLYLVHRGDTLESVSGKTGVAVKELIALNKADPRQALTPGTPLLIPARQAAQEASAAQVRPVQAVAAQPVREAQEDMPEEKTELNPAPKYKIIRRSGT
jgi:membrane-bound lytic murein transglycosylase D